MMNRDSESENYCTESATIGTLTNCTAFCLDNNGAAVFGANLDLYNQTRYGLMFINKRNTLKTGLRPSATGEIAQWVSKYGSLTFNLLGYQYAWGGVNESGLAISSLALTETHPPSSDHRPPVDDHFWNQYILDTCASVDDVIASEFKVLNTSVGNHHLISDKNGNCVVVEWLGGKTIFYTADRLPIKALTNTIYGRSLRFWTQNWGKLAYSLRYPGGTLARFCKAADRVVKFKSTLPAALVDYAFETLKIVSVPAIMRIPGIWGLVYFPERTLKESFSKVATQWSIVYDAKSNRIYYRTHDNPARRYVDLWKLDFSFTTPVKMMNIDKGSGDVTNEFTDYSHEVNFNHHYRFVKNWNLLKYGKVPDTLKEITENEIRHFEGYHQAS